MFALSDETTPLTSGTQKLTVRAPFTFSITSVRASLTTASNSGAVITDINVNGVSILSSLLSIDANEKTSTTAATAATIASPSVTTDTEITFDIDNAGTGASGLKVTLFVVRT